MYMMYAKLCVGPALHPPVAPIAARIPSSNTGERGPHTIAKCGNCFNEMNKINQTLPMNK